MTGTITSLTIQKRDKERVNVFLDGAYAFSLSLDAALGLKRGQYLSPADIERLQGEDEAQRAYLYALRLLAYRPRSAVEMEQRLRQKDYTASSIAAALERLRAKNHLDDEAFARFWLDRRERFRPRGARALSYELRQKGVDRETIDHVLTDVDEAALAWNAVAGKLPRWRGLEPLALRKKIMGFLSRRGFAYDTARQVCQRALEEADA
jgi:regulatory protein